ncbi:MAG: protein translocase subunit SecF [Candidatus Buchananbacteria bacterium]|nr:protein translocase subunit SecF [Candidatus Buchananbacteria bacterium]
MKFNIIKNRKYFYTLSGVLALISILSLIAWGLKPGLDFTGGSLLELSFKNERPATEAIQKSLADLNLGEIIVQPLGDNNNILRFKDVDEDTHQKILSNLKEAFKNKETGSEEASLVTEERFESVGPVLGKELESKAWTAISFASIMIVLYIAYAFRKVSKPVESWKFGLAAIIALIHDLLIVTGLFSLLGHFAGVEIDGLFITALLTILGFSVHDTIVVFDRTRENLSKHYSSNFEEVVNDSINQTITRSINTSLTALIVLTTLYFLGGSTISNFVLALIAGIIFGTYSSIFVASPILVTWYNWDKKFRKK